MTTSPEGRLSRRTLTVWFVAGFMVAGLMMYQRQSVLGELNGLLLIGTANGMAEAVEEDFDRLVIVDETGHDGQYSYAIAVDPFGARMPEHMDVPGYRYRRVLLSWLGGLFGSLSGDQAIVGLAFFTAAGAGLAAASVSAIAQTTAATRWSPLAVLGHPGVWASAQILSADLLALGFAIAGLASWFRSRFWVSVALFAAAVLTKDQYLLFPLAVAVLEVWRGNRRRVFFLLAGAAAPLTLWTTWIALRIDGSLSSGSNLGLPVAGIIEAAPLWKLTVPEEQVQTLLGILILLASMLVFVKTPSRTWRVLTGGWILLAVLAQVGVWIAGSNFLRTTAPLAPLTLLARTSGHGSTTGHTSR